MSSENTVSGRGGSVSIDGAPLLRIKNWSVTVTRAGGSEWGDSDSEGYTNRSVGRKDCTFTCEGVFDTTSPQTNIIDPNDVVAVSLGSGSGGPSYSFERAICTDFSLTVDADTEEVIGWNASFGTDGEFTN